MKTKLFALIMLVQFPLGSAAQLGSEMAIGLLEDLFMIGAMAQMSKDDASQGGTVKARLKEKYDSFCRHGDGTSTDPFWYSVKRDGKEGACDANGREIIPPSRYDDICRHGDGTSAKPFWYSVKRDGKKGACDANGREIIPPGRYDDVHRHGDGTSAKPLWYSVERDGKEGACDANGREIIPPGRYDDVIYSDGVFKTKTNGEWVSLGIRLGPDGTAR